VIVLKIVKRPADVVGFDPAAHAAGPTGRVGRVDALLDDPVFSAPYAAHFDARIGGPSIPMETKLRLMFLKFRYRLSYESLCREVADSISWQRFAGSVPHPGAALDATWTP
jgi:IS5 family transposase